MKVVSLEKVELLIEEANTNVDIFQEAKEELIQKNVQAINELIQKKLKEISSQIREESIKEICGKDLEYIENDIAKEKEKIELLSSLILDDTETIEENNTEDENITDSEEIE